MKKEVYFFTPIGRKLVLDSLYAKNPKCLYCGKVLEKKDFFVIWKTCIGKNILTETALCCGNCLEKI